MLQMQGVFKRLIKVLWMILRSEHIYEIGFTEGLEQFDYEVIFMVYFLCPQTWTAMAE